MATINKRITCKGARYQVQIRKQGHQPIFKSFETLKDARTFAKDTEAKMERSVFQCAREAESILFGDLADRYLREVLIHKKGYAKERYNIRPVIRFFKGYRLAELKPHTITAFRQYRLGQVSGSTVRREMGLISRILVSAERDFGIYLPQGNPATKVKKPEEATRSRRPTSMELTQLIADEVIGAYVELAVETGMRRGEIVGIKPEHFAGKAGDLLLIPDTKTGIPRTIPLSRRAQGALSRLLEARNGCGKIAAKSVSQAFSRACKRHGIEDLRFHDLRHEATSRFFERGLNVMEVSLITGHRSHGMLSRYTHLNPKDLVERLD